MHRGNQRTVAPTPGYPEAVWPNARVIAEGLIDGTWTWAGGCGVRYRLIQG
jgi:hypothetical protein